MSSKRDEDPAAGDAAGAVVPYEDDQREDGEVEDSDGEQDPSLPVIKATTNDRFSAIPATSGPALPYDDEPALPDEAPPQANDDGWRYLRDDTNGYIFYNEFTGVRQFENPRVQAAPPTYGPYDRFANYSSFFFL